MTQGNTMLARGLIVLCEIVDAFAMVLLCFASAYAGAWLAFMLVVAANVAVGAYAVKQGLPFEWQTEKKFKKVCAGVDLIGQSTKLGFWDIGVGRMLDLTGKKAEAASVVYPRLRRLVGTRQQWTAEITPLYGHKVDGYSKRADAFSLAFNVAFVGFDIAENGLIRIRAGRVPVPAAYDFEE